MPMGVLFVSSFVVSVGDEGECSEVESGACLCQQGSDFALLRQRNSGSWWHKVLMLLGQWGE